MGLAVGQFAVKRLAQQKQLKLQCCVRHPCKLVVKPNVITSCEAECNELHLQFCNVCLIAIQRRLLVDHVSESITVFRTKANLAQSRSASHWTIVPWKCNTHSCYLKTLYMWVLRGKTGGTGRRRTISSSQIVYCVQSAACESVQAWTRLTRIL